jgi:dipeptidyl aminopeptidase/acylaminoacyl peptidase
MFYDEVHDVLAAADALVREPDVDSRRIYLAGHSSGASLALLTALTSRRFRAVASFSGSPDFARLAALPGMADFAPFALDDPAEIRMRSSMEFAAAFSCPVRLFWGDDEPGVAEDNVGTIQRGRAAGRDIDSIVVHGGHESMIGPATARAIAFFQQH